VWTVPDAGGGREGPTRHLQIRRLIDLPKISDVRGNLTFIEGGRHIPFQIRRVYYLYDVPGGAVRAGHAHKTLEQVVIAVSGSFDVLLDNGVQRERIHLCRSYYGVYIPPMVWRELNNFSTGAVCVVLASDFYNEADYYRDYGDFLHAVAGRDHGQTGTIP
jgi:dTDP-4-dehydrorhamnose 3,5-epimerase-like enzyme